MRISHQFKQSLSLLILAVGLVGFGCQDKWSQRRIQMRNEHFASTVQDVDKSEQIHIRRLGEAQQTLNRAWRMDCERFRERSQQVGDYFW